MFPDSLFPIPETSVPTSLSSRNTIRNLKFLNYINSYLIFTTNFEDVREIRYEGPVKKKKKRLGERDAVVPID